MPGSQLVSALKGCIDCPADRNLHALGMAVTGSFFYVEGVFLVDPQGPDYVGPILAFCRQHGIHPPQPPPQEEAEALPRTHRRRRQQQDGGQLLFPPLKSMGDLKPARSELPISSHSKPVLTPARF